MFHLALISAIISCTILSYSFCCIHSEFHYPWKAKVVYSDKKMICWLVWCYMVCSLLTSRKDYVKKHILHSLITLYTSVSMVLLNCNFIFPHMILRGTTTILQYILITCLHGPHLLMSCNVHVSWKYMRGSTHLMEVNMWKYTSCGSKLMEVHVHGRYTCVAKHRCINLLIKSIALHYTNILLVDQHNAMYGLFSSAHIKSWWISSNARKFGVKYTVIFLIKLMGLVTNLNNLIACWTSMRWTGKEMASSCSVRTMRYICLFDSCLMYERCVVCNYYEQLYACNCCELICT